MNSTNFQFFAAILKKSLTNQFACGKKHARQCMDTPTYTCTHIHIHAHTHTRAHTHTHNTHTHTHIIHRHTHTACTSYPQNHSGRYSMIRTLGS